MQFCGENPGKLFPPFLKYDLMFYFLWMTKYCLKMKEHLFHNLQKVQIPKKELDVSTHLGKLIKTFESK